MSNVNNGSSRKVVAVSMNEEEYAKFLELKDMMFVSNIVSHSDSAAIKMAIACACAYLAPYQPKV